MHENIEWRIVDEFPSYEVSSNGDVRHIIKKTIKKQRLNISKRYVVTLARGTYVTPKAVHRIMAIAFLGKVPKGMEVCHNDGNATNNNLLNLRYDTKRENQRDRKKHGTDNSGERNGRSKLTLQQVLKIRKDFRNVNLLTLDYGVSKHTIWSIRRKETWSHINEPAQV